MAQGPSPDEARIREQIGDLTRELWEMRQAQASFEPGVTRVNYAGRVYDSAEMEMLVSAALDCWLTAGPYAARFERGMNAFLGSKHTLLVNSGSSANLLCIAALTAAELGERRLRPGDEVITVAAGFPTTASCILQNGLTPVFVDVQIGTYNATAEAVAEAISPRTRAIFLPHTLGNPFDLTGIGALARKAGIWLVEDNCDSLGSRFPDPANPAAMRYTGTFGDLASLSFFPAHHITMGEGGAVVTDDPLLARVVCSLRDWGRDCYCDPGRSDSCGRRFSGQFGALPEGYDHKYVYSHLGYNLKLTDLQAAFGVAQLEKLPRFIAARKANSASLHTHLRQYDDALILPEATPGSDPAWFAFPITVSPDASFTRADLVGYLEAHKVETRFLFGGNLLRQPAFMDAPCRVSGELSGSDMVMTNTFFIGVYPGLDGARLGYVLEVFDAFFAGATASREAHGRG